ncbi:MULTISPECIES: glycoside hydrolase family 3 protein [Hungatella]|uniref:beta-N-acetylhexosaminidase n=1 Tax=Hungatella hathewayi TaxID=154046 RepID=A0AAW9WQV4_9FIRM|nr:MULTISPECIES: glycoside hydrolase family 3 N-terminal domain-containing protein [Hungatella]MCQ4833036.1 glycosyl hydrolase [Hungatella sp. SL.1.14]MUB67118.1 glycosyl hydrolase [Hungatella hathewayi]CUQ59650.1 beta-hexosamidase A [Hungatella hathewayi]
MVNLREKPYYLKDEDIRWVEDTIASMTDEEKIGQLFVNMVTSRKPEDLENVVKNYHVGAIRYHNTSPEELYEQNRILQEHSRIPLLIASNCEAGGNGGVGGGTAVACGAATAAADDEETAYEVARIGAAESAAIGCNWNFAPVVDLLYNWRNTIVQCRAFNNSPEDTIRYAKSFFRGTRTQNMATCMKHFPGDGTEENDQHLLMGVNDMTCEEWDNTFGKVYKELIDDGVMTIMAGHIALPAYTRKLRPDTADEDILPATLSPELITDLLKGRLGFNGMVVTDASHMIGMFAAMPRREQVPRAIAAGCDMFLFFNDMDEDFGYMMEGYRNGVITEERLSDALHRILGIKAALKLHKLQAEGRLMPPREQLSVIGCREFRESAAKQADKFITLVKDTKHYLPLTLEKYKRVKLVFIGGEGTVVAGKLQSDDSAPVKEMVIRKLTEAGFTVDGETPAVKGKMEDLRKTYDVCLVVLNVSGFAQYNTMRVKWAQPADQPWYVSELPTVFLSLNFTNHLIDVPMAKTYINAYLNSEEAVSAAIDKMTGKSPFKGRYNETVFCGRWDTRI